MKKLLLIGSMALSASLFNLCNAQYTDLHDFNGTDGSNPYGSFLFSGHKLWSMTQSGGSSIAGNIFSIFPNGSGDNSFYEFSGTDGSSPYGTVIAVKGKLYGMTNGGGANGLGDIYSIDTSGVAFQDLWDFNGGSSTNGAAPYGNLLLVKGKLYGMSSNGGTNSLGNVFSIDTNGTNYTDLYNFTAGSGNSPQGSLIIVHNLLYGMTFSGGANGAGTVFSIDTAGTSFKDRWDFQSGSATNGANPRGSLVLVGKLLFGMTSAGGLNSSGNIFSLDTNANGTTYKDRWNFDAGGDTNGSIPFGELVYNGKALYGMTSAGGTPGSGNIFCIDTNGTRYKDLFDFNGSNGSDPHGDLTLSGVVVYGMTAFGGANTDGVVFSDTLLSVKFTDTAVSCNGGANGHATAHVTGAITPFTYSWSAGGTFDKVSGLSAGTYTVTVTDANGLVATASVSITQPTALAVTMSSHTNENCFGDGSASATANTPTGGTTPYTYSWSGGGGNNITANGLTAGSYTVTTTDHNGCTATASVSITQPTALAVTMASHTNEPCNGDATASVTANPATGGTGAYTYSWTPIGNTTLNVTGLSAGSYTITVTDGHGCTGTTAVTVTQPLVISATAHSTADSTGSSGTAAIHPNGGTPPYTYLWAPGGETTDSISNLLGASYTCTVTDANGCTYTTHVIVNSTVGIDNITHSAGQITIYPNPNNGNFTVALSGTNEKSFINIYNVLGEKIYTMDNSSALNSDTKYLINLSSQPAGVYLYRVFTQSGGLIGQGKLVIQK